MAAVWRAPVVFVCENNLYGEFSPRRRTTPLTDLADRAAAYAIPGQVVDGMDVVAVHHAMTAAVARARAGEGPTLLEVKTYRYRGHSRTDPARYRSAEELQSWKARDPINRLADALEAAGLLVAADVAAMKQEVQAQIDVEAATAAGDAFPTLADARASVFAS
jgi:TPP-dependent pyruvate/acetoin dehydrogenase alpha subunit